MIKMINIDIDGTLLNEYGEITKRTINAFEKAKKQGIEVVLTTGRPVKSSKTLARESGASNYIICANGAIVYDATDSSYIWKDFLSVEKLFEIIDICEENSIYYNVYTEDEILTKKLEYNTLFYSKENIYKTMEKRTNINIVKDVKEYIIRNNIQSVLKITVCDKNKSIFDNISTKLKKLDGVNVLDTAWMSRKVIKYGTEEVTLEYYYTEISAKDVNKKKAIEILANKLGIQKEEIMAIGDNVNDEEMIEYAGLGVAMGNSGERLKKLADVITLENSKDGVAFAIEKYALNMEGVN